jgi:hypothetical protein
MLSLLIVEAHVYSSVIQHRFDTFINKLTIYINVLVLFNLKIFI